MDAKLKTPAVAAVAAVAASAVTTALCYAAVRRLQQRRSEGESYHETERRQKLRMDRGTMERLVVQAVREGEDGWEEGGIPIGAVIADEVQRLQVLRAFFALEQPIVPTLVPTLAMPFDSLGPPCMTRFSNARYPPIEWPCRTGTSSRGATTAVCRTVTRPVTARRSAFEMQGDGETGRS